MSIDYASNTNLSVIKLGDEERTLIVPATNTCSFDLHPITKQDIPEEKGGAILSYYDGFETFENKTINIDNIFSDDSEASQDEEDEERMDKYDFHFSQDDMEILKKFSEQPSCELKYEEVLCIAVDFLYFHQTIPIPSESENTNDFVYSHLEPYHLTDILDLTISFFDATRVMETLTNASSDDIADLIVIEDEDQKRAFFKGMLL